MSHKVFVVEYLTDLDNKSGCKKQLFDNFKDTMSFCSELSKQRIFYRVYFQ